MALVALQAEFELSTIDIVEIEAVVIRRLAGRVRDFRVKAVAGGLILQGESCTFHAKQLAQHIIMQLTLVPILANQIEVAITFGPAS